MNQLPEKDIIIEKWYALLEEGEELPVILNTPPVKKETSKVEEPKKEERSAVNEEGSVEESNLAAQISNLRKNRRG